MKKVLLISGGEFAPLPEGFCGYDFVIACDKGLEYAGSLEIVPDLVIGDFDSYEGSLDGLDPSDSSENPELSEWRKEGAGRPRVIRLKPEKDDTDTISAARVALEQGAEEIHICCAFGGRLDHTMANIQTAAFIAAAGARAVICGRESILYSLQNDRLVLKRRPDAYLSLFALTQRCEGVTAWGVKYPLEDGVLTSDYPLGVSNEWTEEEAVIQVKKGLLAVIVSEGKN